jgi:hypothetical protein
MTTLIDVTSTSWITCTFVLFRNTYTHIFIGHNTVELYLVSCLLLF